MTVTTAQRIDGLVDAIIDRLDENKTALGATDVSEGDEDPRYIQANTLYVLPLVEGKDDMKTHPGETGEMQHQFPVSIIGYYKYLGRTAIPDGLRPVRKYGYDVIDLFAGGPQEAIEGAAGSGADTETVVGMVTDPSAESGYFRVADYVIHYFIVRLNLIAIL